MATHHQKKAEYLLEPVKRPLVGNTIQIANHCIREFPSLFLGNLFPNSPTTWLKLQTVLNPMDTLILVQTLGKASWERSAFYLKELLYSFSLGYLNCQHTTNDWLQVTETVENEIVDKEEKTQYFCVYGDENFNMVFLFFKLSTEKKNEVCWC